MTDRYTEGRDGAWTVERTVPTIHFCDRPMWQRDAHHFDVGSEWTCVVCGQKFVVVGLRYGGVYQPHMVYEWDRTPNQVTLKEATVTTFRVVRRASAGCPAATVEVAVVPASTCPCQSNTATTST